MRRLFILFLILLMADKLTAQFPYTQKFNAQVKLPTQVIYDMLADSKGYIWLATDKGLYRFNGSRFTEIPFDKTSLKSISYLQQDPAGNIWCMNFYKELFYFKNDTLHKFNLKNPEKFTNATFLNLVVTTNDIWIGTFEELYQINKKTGDPIQKIIPPKAGISYLLNMGDTIYAYGGNGWLFTYPKFGKQNWEKTNYQNLGNIHIVSNGKSLFVSSIGTIRTPGFKIDQHKLSSIPALQIPSNTVVYHFATTDIDEQWVCTQSGGYLWNVKTGKTTLYFPNQSITDIVKDYQGNYWVATLDNGLFVCPSLENKLYKMHLGELDNITSIAAINNHQVVTGSSKGLLTSFDVLNNSIFQYNLTDAREIEFIHYDTISKNIFSNRGIIKVGEKNPIENYDYSKQVARDPFGNMIVAYFNGAYIINNRFGLYSGRTPKITCNLYKKFSPSMVYRLIKDALILRTTRSNTVLASANKKQFWIAYVDGLFEYHYQDSFRIIKNTEGLPIVAKTLFEMKDGSLIAGTSTDGIYIIKDGLVTHHFDKLTGLKSDNIKHCKYFNNAIWALTDESLELINISTGAIRNLSDEFGFEQLQVNDFTVNPARFFLATTNGVLVNSFPTNKQERVISFPTFNATANENEFVDQAILPFNTNNIIFNIEALHFKSPTSLMYKYRMIGLDSTWRTTNYFTQSITYSRLLAGKYTFQIQAQDRSGYYKSKLLVHTFKIQLPFWLRWWFILLVLFSLILLVYILLKWWSKRILIQQTLKEQLFKSQLVALRSQMNPHFLYNVLNTVQGLLYDNRKTEAGTLLGNFSDLMRKILKASDTQLQTLQEEVENLNLYLQLEKARFDTDFNYSIQTNLTEDASSIYIPSLMLQPFVENAVKHGLMHKHGLKELFIIFDQIEGGLKVVIEDNGIGRKHSEIINSRNKSKPSSFATKAIEERIQLFNRLYKQKITYTVIDKTDEGNLPIGTLVSIFIPDYTNEASQF